MFFLFHVVNKKTDSEKLGISLKLMMRKGWGRDALGSPTVISTLAARSPPTDSMAYTFHPCFPSSHWFCIEALWMSLERHLLIRKLGAGFGPTHGILWMHENLTCRDQPRTKRLKDRELWALLRENWDNMRWKKVLRGLSSLSKLHRREK